MKIDLLIILVLVLNSVAVTAIAADPKDFGKGDIDAIWPELWESSSGVKMPVVDPLSQSQVISQMTGNWSTWSQFDKVLLFLGTNEQASVSGVQDGKKWEKQGEWKVISNKLVLFLPEDQIPVFIFRTEGRPYIFNPWAKTLMSEMQRPAILALPSAKSVETQPVLAENGKISKAQVLEILQSKDTGLLNKNAAAVVSHFARNAVITATVVED